MTDLVVGLGIALVLEGILWALAPNMARRMVEELAKSNPEQLRWVALMVAAMGVALVWLGRSFSAG